MDEPELKIAEIRAGLRPSWTTDFILRQDRERFRRERQITTKRDTERASLYSTHMSIS